MNTFTDIVLILGFLALTAVVAQMVRATVRGDGYGRRPSPRSHHEDLFAGGRARLL